MKFSVVIPAHDDQATLNETVASFLRQTIPAHEIIVVDDGSAIPITVPDSVKLIRIDRIPGERGSSFAKNTGASFANGDWIVFSDDDIVHAPDALESIAAKITELDRGDILINVFSVTPTSTINENSVSEAMLGHLVSSEQHCGVIKADWFKEIGKYDSDSFMAWGYNNQDLSIRVFRAGGVVISNVISIKTGELLTCVHVRPSIHNSDIAKSDFKRKYGRAFNPSMLMEDSVAAS